MDWFLLRRFDRFAVESFLKFAKHNCQIGGDRMAELADHMLVSFVKFLGTMAYMTMVKFADGLAISCRLVLILG